MTCDNYRDLISARIDDELDAAEEAQLDSHLGTCASCHAYENDAWALRRSMRLRPAEDEQPTPTLEIVSSLRLQTSLRMALFVIGGILVALNVGPIVSSDSGVGAHLNRHDGVFGVALGIGMVAVAARPQRAIGLVPITTAVAVLMIAVAIADIGTGNVSLVTEAVHVVQFAGLVCLWMISGGPSRVPRHIESVTRRFASSQPSNV